MDLMFLGKVIDRAIRTLYMADADDFNEIFGEGGPHLWSKFSDKYDKREGDFICSLDGDNLTKLAAATLAGLTEDLKLREGVT